MPCSTCGRENRAGRRFCAHCGAKLALVCASCKAANEPGEQFCGECGGQLAEPAKPPPPPHPRSYTPKHLASTSSTSRTGARRRASRRPRSRRASRSHRVVTVPSRRLTPAKPAAREASDALAAHTDSVSAELRVDTRQAVRPTGAIVHGTNPIEEPGVRSSNTPCEARRRGEVGIGHDSPQAGSARATVLIGVRLSRMPSRIRSIVL